MMAVEHPAGRSGHLSPELVESMKGRLRQLSRAEVRPLRAERPLADLLRGVEVRGEVSIELEHSVPFTARRTAENPPTFELQIDRWPEGYEPISIVLGQFEFPQVEPLTIERPRVQRRAAAANESRAAHAFTLSADTSSGAQKSNNWRAENGGLAASYDPQRGRLEVADRIGESLGDYLVAELSALGDDGQPTLRRRLVEPKTISGVPARKAHVSFNRTGLLPGSDEQVTLRGMTAGDLDLLDADRLTEFLGDNDFLAMPIEAREGRFVFAAEWEPEQQLVGCLSTNWFVQCAAPAKEVEL